MNKLVAVLVLLSCVALGVGTTAYLRAADTPATQPSADKPTNTKCPVSGDAIDPSTTVVYKGKTIAFCCADCVKSFNEDPAKYLAKMK